MICGNKAEHDRGRLLGKGEKIQEKLYTSLLCSREALDHDISICWYVQGTPLGLWCQNLHGDIRTGSLWLLLVPPCLMVELLHKADSTGTSVPPLSLFRHISSTQPHVCYQSGHLSLLYLSAHKCLLQLCLSAIWEG